MFNAISSLVGSQTGVNSGQLITDLLAASRQPREAALRNQEQLNSARVSALASASSSLDTLATALRDMLDGRTFAGEITSSQPSLASVRLSSNAKPRGLPATLEIDQIASAQRLMSPVMTNGNVALGAGSMTITTGGSSFLVELDSQANSLSDLVNVINTADKGVIASIMKDADGARIVLEGGIGSNKSFSVSGDFASLNYPAGSSMTLLSSAGDAQVKLSGVPLRFESNNLQNIISAIDIDLLNASPGTKIIINGDRPVSTISGLVSDFVNGFNQLRSGLNTATAAGSAGNSGGPLAGDAGIREIIRDMGRLGSVSLTDSGPFRSLSDIGVRTNRDGTLTINKVQLERILATNPDAVSDMLDPQVSSAEHPGIAGVIDAIRSRLQDGSGPLAASKARLEKAREGILAAREKLVQDSDRQEQQLRKTFANMDRQLVQLQATQSYLTQQIAIWNNNKN